MHEPERRRRARGRTRAHERGLLWLHVDLELGTKVEVCGPVPSTVNRSWAPSSRTLQNKYRCRNASETTMARGRDRPLLKKKR